MSEPAGATGYDGAVTTGAAPQTRVVPGLIITKVALGPFDNNCYLLRDPDSATTTLIDAATDAAGLLRLAGDTGIDQVITTHRHQDHWGALAEVVAATGARTAAGRHDVEGIPVASDRALDDGDVVRVGGAELEVIELVGHTPGAIALLYRGDPQRPHLFTGDCLFPGGVGNTFGDPAAFDRLLSDVTTKLFDRLPDETWVYPGHGGDTTLGAERPQLAAWRERGW